MKERRKGGRLGGNVTGDPVWQGCLGVLEPVTCEIPRSPLNGSA